MMASLKLGARKKLYFFGARPELKLGAQTKLGKGANKFVGISGRRGIAEF